MLVAQRPFISASVGISLYPSDALSTEQLLRNADATLYKAKQNGRACHALYTEELTAHAQARVETVGELRRAHEQPELRVFYQPVHDLAGGQRVGVEALIRWQAAGDVLDLVAVNQRLFNADATRSPPSCTTATSATSTAMTLTITRLSNR